MIRHNLFYKLFALAVAIALWTYVNAERNPQSHKSYTIALSVLNPIQGYSTELATHEVTVNVDGLKTDVDNIRKDDIAAWVDLDDIDISGRSSATRSLQVRTRLADVPSQDGITVSAYPSNINVKLEAMSGKRLPVEVKLVSSPPLGFSYGIPEVTPESVSITGKAAEVAKVKRTIVSLPEQISSSGIDDYFKVIPIDIKGNFVKGVDLSPDKIRLKMKLVEVPATKAVIVSPTVVGDPKYPAKVTKVTVNPSSITLEGKPSSLVGVSTITTDKISVDGASGDVSQEITLHEPPGVHVVGAPKVKITVYISAKEQ